MAQWKLIGFAFATALLMYCTVARADFDDLSPINPQPAAEAIKPGLAVRYVYPRVRHVDAIESTSGGEIGKPLPQLNYHTGTGKVLTSDRSDFVGAKIRGMIRFEQTGRWVMAAESNDGIRVRLADKIIIVDPDVHADRFSKNAGLIIAVAGWYKLEITYFERKNTSTLRLFWQPPGGSKLEIVPAEAFGYLP